jgi:hypothetical protein
MTWKVISVAAVALLAMTCGTLLAMAGTYGKGDPKHPQSAGGWSAALTELANRTDRIGGHWINAIDNFEYAGDADAFNDFLAAYARIPEAPHTFFIEPPMRTTTGAVSSPGYDWEMQVINYGGPTTTVTLRLGGRVDLSKVKVPPGVRAEAGVGATDEIKRFVERQTKDAGAGGAPSTRPATRPADVR